MKTQEVHACTISYNTSNLIYLKKMLMHIQIYIGKKHQDIYVNMIHICIYIYVHTYICIYIYILYIYIIYIYIL
jgi:hypothetical protein